MHVMQHIGSADPYIKQAFKTYGFVKQIVLAWAKNRKSPSFLEDQQKVLAEWDRKHGAGTSLTPVAIPDNSLAVPNQVPVPKKAPVPGIRVAPTKVVVTNATNVPTDASGTATVPPVARCNVLIPATLGWRSRSSNDVAPMF